ncbi:MAG: DNA cytosine methyltransferase [Firmicutes bacterium]|nr:DNA cytosine methyltransferase [Bacillota bacterium]
MIREFTVLHLFSGIGGAALGFQQATGEYKGMVGKFRTLAGIDVDPEACEDFRNLTGAPAVQMDLFSREDYRAFHEQEPPNDWREATPGDLLGATGGEHPDVVFLSPPCKGFSGLLPAKKAASEKYQALNSLVVRGLRLVLLAFWDDLPAVILLENVPRITTRGSHLLQKIKLMLRNCGYLLHEGHHDCGELGGLGQRRRRYLLIARLPEKMSAFIYRPPKRRVKSVGEVIGPLPFPDDPAAGPLHRLPRLQWKTWVRLALIPAGGDWRDLERLAVGGYHNAYRIIPWNCPSGTVTSGNSLSCGGVSVADLRLGYCPRKGAFRVARWNEPATTVIGSASVRGSNGVAAVADPRLLLNPNAHHNILRVVSWDDPASTVTGAARPAGGAISVADPRPVADPRLGCRPRNGSYKVMRWDEPAVTVVGACDIHAGAAAVADPRIPADDERPDPPPVIIAMDGTWHRPLTTLELAVLQGFPAVLPDGRPLVLAGNSDARWRERIGNAVPPPAAKAMAEQILNALLVSERKEWTLGNTGLWVRKPATDDFLSFLTGY